MQVLFYLYTLHFFFDEIFNDLLHVVLQQKKKKKKKTSKLFHSLIDLACCNIHVHQDLPKRVRRHWW